MTTFSELHIRPEYQRRVLRFGIAGALFLRAMMILGASQSSVHGHDFWRRVSGRPVATPLLVALVVIETTDIVFALDSVPAVVAITRNPFIVCTSNVMAMLDPERS